MYLLIGSTVHDLSPRIMEWSSLHTLLKRSLDLSQWDIYLLQSLKNENVSEYFSTYSLWANDHRKGRMVSIVLIFFVNIFIAKWFLIQKAIKTFAFLVKCLPGLVSAFSSRYAFIKTSSLSSPKPMLESILVTSKVVVFMNSTAIFKVCEPIFPIIKKKLYWFVL